MGFQFPLQFPFQSNQELIHREQIIPADYNIGVHREKQYVTNYATNIADKILTIETDYTIDVLNKIHTYNTDYNITINYPYLKLVISDGVNTWTIPTDFTPEPNKKYFVSIAYRSGEQHIYIGDEEGNFTEIAVDNIAIPDNIWNGNFKIGCSTTGNHAHATFDEVLYKPYMASKDEVRSWWALQSPFIDPNNKIDAQSQPIIAGKGGVLINEEGAWGYKNGVKQAGFGTDGKWMAGEGSIVADQNGLNIADGTILGDENGFKIISPNGDFSTFDGDQLRFFKAGYPDKPFIYSRRVAYGTTTSGGEVDLAEETGVPWDYPPKVLTSIKNLRSYTGGYSAYDQYYDSYADVITKDGFYVYGNSIVPGQTVKRTINQQRVAEIGGSSSASWTSDYSEISTIKLRLYMYYMIDCREGGPAWGRIRVCYRKSGGSWITYKEYYSSSGYVSDYVTYNIPFSGNQIDSYQWGIFVNINPTSDWEWWGAGAYIYWWESEFNGENIANGEVNWIAIEGGAPPDPDDEN